MKKLEKITSENDIILFREAITNEIKAYIANIEHNLSERYGIEILNEGVTHICHIFKLKKPFLTKKSLDSINIFNFMFCNGFNLNKNTTDYQLRKVVDKIIDEYNEKVTENNEDYEREKNWEREFYKKYGMKI